MTTLTRSPGERFSSPIAPALQRFLDWKRAAGYVYRAEAQRLHELDRFLTRHLTAPDPAISWDLIRAYVARRDRESETTRQHRLSLIRQVCRFLALEQPQTPIPGPRFLEIRRTVFVPRVMTREEGRQFLQTCATFASPHRSALRNTIWGTALSLLYLTGLRSGEVLRLTNADVDLDAAVLRVRHTKFGKSRLVPIAAETTSRLQACRNAVARRFGPPRPDAPFFPAPSGRCYSKSALQKAFHDVLAAAGIPRHHGGRALRVHDARHSFATTRLLLWYEQGVDLNTRLPVLATYLGHVGLRSSHRYLQLTEEIAQEVVRRHAARFGYLITERRPS
jgi:integrase/recombinase XerD